MFVDKFELIVEGIYSKMFDHYPKDEEIEEFILSIYPEGEKIRKIYGSQYGGTDAIVVPLGDQEFKEKFKTAPIRTFVMKTKCYYKE